MIGNRMMNIFMKKKGFTTAKELTDYISENNENGETLDLNQNNLFLDEEYMLGLLNNKYDSDKDLLKFVNNSYEMKVLKLELVLLKYLIIVGFVDDKGDFYLNSEDLEKKILFKIDDQKMLDDAKKALFKEECIEIISKKHTITRYGIHNYYDYYIMNSTPSDEKKFSRDAKHMNQVHIMMLQQSSLRNEQNSVLNAYDSHLSDKQNSKIQRNIMIATMASAIAAGLSLFQALMNP